MANPVSLFDDTEEDDIAVSAQVSCKNPPLFDEEDETESVPRFSQDMEQIESPRAPSLFSRLKDGPSQSQVPALFEDEEGVKATPPPPSLFEDDSDIKLDIDHGRINCIGPVSAKEVVVGRKPSLGLFEEKKTGGRKPSLGLFEIVSPVEQLQPEGQPTTDREFLFGSERNRIPPRSLFDDNEGDKSDDGLDNVGEEEEEYKVAEYKNIYDDGPMSLFEQDSNGEEGEELSSGSSESDLGDEEDKSDSVTKKSSLSFKLSTTVFSREHDMKEEVSPQREKKDKTGQRRTIPSPESMEELRRALEAEKNRVAELEKLLAKADKKIISLQKEVGDLRRKGYVDGANGEKNGVGEEEKDISRRRRLAQVQQQQRRRKKNSSKKATHNIEPLLSVSPKDLNADGRSSLSSFDDSDIDVEVLAPCLPPVVAASSQSAVPPNDNADFDTVDSQVDELVCLWAAGKNIVDMLKSLPDVWTKANPNISDLSQQPLPSPSVIRREYLTCVRKVHPDKQPHSNSGDIEGKRQFLLAQKLFAALTDAYRMWKEHTQNDI